MLLPEIKEEILREAAKTYDFATEDTLREAFLQLRPYVRTRTVEKGHILLHLDERPDRLGYVSSGILRKFCFDCDGKDQTLTFYPEGSFFSEGMMQRETKSEFLIDALEDTEITYVELFDIEDIIYDDPKIMKLYIKFSETELINFVMEGLRFNVSAADRYKQFTHRYPTLEGRISQKEIAKYLGISPVSLSRLKKSGELD